MPAEPPLTDDLLEHLPFPVSLTRVADGKYVFVNAPWSGIFGYSREEAVGRTVAEIGIYHDAARRKDLLAALARDGQVRDFEIELLRKSGEPRTCLVNANRIERGGETFLLAVTEDITQRKAAERALQVARDRFRRAVQDSGIGMAIYSATGKYLEVNDALCRMLGYSAEELLRIDWRTITHPDDVAPTEDVGRAMRAGNVIRLEKRYLRKDGSVVWVELTSSALREPDGQVREYLTQLVDVTARKLAEEEERRSTVARQLARELLRHAAGGSGEQGARRELGRRLGRESGKQGLDAALAAYRAMGIGELRLVREEHGRYEFASTDGLDLQPSAAAPTCFLTLGFVEGVVTALAGHESLGAELRCQSQGHAACQLVVRAGAG